MSSEFVLRKATSADVLRIRDLLADDELGAQREDLSEQGPARYKAAFEKIESDARNDLWVALLDARVVGTYQLTYIPYLSRGGNERALVEAVRVASDYRNRGIGELMMRHAMAEARERGCLLMQLTTDKTRSAAHRFYRRLGFRSSHEGMKLDLSDPATR